MISEPEFDGWSGATPDPKDQLDPRDRLDPPQARAQFAPRPWWWALGGALLASVLWAAAWWAMTPQDDRPPLRYALTPSLCERAKLPGLTRMAGVGAWDYTPRLWEHPGVDRAVCMAHTQPPDDAQERPPWLAYQSQVSVELHKLNDPEAEFGADLGQSGWIGMSRPDPRSVPGLGERALIWDAEYDNEWRLTVLDGGAVFTLDVSAWTGGEDGDGEASVTAGSDPPQDPPRPDSDAVQAAMIDDMRVLMKALRR